MSEDPYHAFRTELQSSLSQAHVLHSSLGRIRAMAGSGGAGVGKSEELREVEDELRGTLAALEADLEELESSVRVVEETGPRLFGISEQELAGRRGYVREVRREIELMRADLSSKLSRPPSYTSTAAATTQHQQSQSQPSVPATSSKAPHQPPDGAPAAEDEQAAWSREEQMMLVEQQDSTLGYISGTLQTLAEQAGLIGREVGEHNEMLDDLEQGVDRTDTKLSGAMKKLRKFIRQTEETKSGYCIIFLIIVLCVLLLAVVLI